MPDARFAPEGSWRTGISLLRPYQTIWSSVTLFPWFEGSFRYTRIYHVPGFEPTEDDPEFGAEFGDFRDKSFDAKLQLLPERRWWPAVAIGAHDVAGGTGLFRATYGVLSKRFGPLDLSLGYGGERIDGAFGGLRWTPSAAPQWSLIAEYDAFDYPRDHRADLSGAAAYEKEAAFGIEYRSEYWGAKLFSSHGEIGANVYINVPMEKREFIPKVNEPRPYTRIRPRPTAEQWHAERSHHDRMRSELWEDDFNTVAIRYEHERLEAALGNSRISSMPRAVGRAARVMLALAPLETRELRITYQRRLLPIVTYTFADTRLLQRYFNGMASREQLAPTVAIEYTEPGAQPEREAEDRAEALTAAAEATPPIRVSAGGGEVDFFVLEVDNVLGGSFNVHPAFATTYNDPSGVLKGELSAIGSWGRSLGYRRSLDLETKLVLWENVSDVTSESNSELPHVRTDVSEYRRASKFKLTRLVVNQYFHPRRRVYARASAGIYEEMFSGFGGQVLYLAERGGWAADLASDWVRQRGFEGWFSYRDYRTVTTIASLHYKMAKGLTATTRVGRFLAKDEGVSFEVKRVFASGFEVGGWYTVTNGNDIQSPGAPGNPYYDKGIFVLMPLNTLLTYDSRASAGISLSPWLRDVGQMVDSPGDLYYMVERPVRQRHDRDGLVRFGDRDDDYDLPRLGAERTWPEFLGQDLAGARRAAGSIDWLDTALAAAGIVLGAAALDKTAEEQARKYQGRRWMDKGIEVGDALPFAAAGLSAAFAFDTTRPQLSDAGIAALEAGGAAFLASTGAKYLVGRARPEAGLGRREFDPGASEDRFQSFPSRTTATMWALVTPYAKEFDMPWLYGVAALTNAASTGSREHWFSDTVAGSLVGYALGHIAWEARRDSRLGRNGPSIAVAPGSVGVSWELE